jgi:hypothetical protein
MMVVYIIGCVRVVARVLFPGPYKRTIKHRILSRQIEIGMLSTCPSELHT